MVGKLIHVGAALATPTRRAKAETAALATRTMVKIGKDLVDRKKKMLHLVWRRESKTEEVGFKQKVGECQATKEETRGLSENHSRGVKKDTRRAKPNLLLGHFCPVPLS